MPLGVYPVWSDRRHLSQQFVLDFWIMPINRSKKRAAVAKSVIEREGGIVILPVREYRRLLENTVPRVYLKGKTARALDRF